MLSRRRTLSLERTRPDRHAHLRNMEDMQQIEAQKQRHSRTMMEIADRRMIMLDQLEDDVYEACERLTHTDAYEVTNAIIAKYAFGPIDVDGVRALIADPMQLRSEALHAASMLEMRRTSFGSRSSRSSQGQEVPSEELLLLARQRSAQLPQRGTQCSEMVTDAVTTVMRTELLAHHRRIQDAKLALKQGRLDVCSYKRRCHESACAFDLLQADTLYRAQELWRTEGVVPIERLVSSEGMLQQVERLAAIDAGAECS